MSKWKRVIREELSSFHGRLILARLLLLPVPPHSGRRLRAMILRRIGGLSIGKSTLILGTPIIVGPGNPWKLLEIGEYVWLNIGVVFDLGARVVIEDEVAIGHQVRFLTNSHMIGGQVRRSRGTISAPICVKEGAWIGAGATLLPGVTVGAGSVVAAGAVVSQDVPPNVLVGGVPAKVIRHLDEDVEISEGQLANLSLEEQ